MFFYLNQVSGPGELTLKGWYEYRRRLHL